MVRLRFESLSCYVVYKTMKQKTVNINGSFGEGGGQILRTSLALSVITQTPFVIEKIRAGRKKDGLLRQHLACVRAAKQISNAQCEGDELRSTRLSFAPQNVNAGHYSFAIGSAGSASLVLQTVIYPLLMAEGESTVTVAGGTHNRWAPTYDFLQESFLPQLRAMGAEVELSLTRPGFFPAGGGEMVCKIKPWKNRRALHLNQRGAAKERRALVSQAKVPLEVAQKEFAKLRKELNISFGDEVRDYKDSVGAGNVLSMHLDFEKLTASFTSFGERGLPAAKVSAALAKEVRRYLEQEAPVEEYLADQLILPMCLVGEGSFTSALWSLHASTNIEVVSIFLKDVHHDVKDEKPCRYFVTSSPHA